MSSQSPPELDPPPPPMEDYPDELGDLPTMTKITPARFTEETGEVVSSVKKSGSGYKSGRKATKAAIEGWNSTPQHKRSVFGTNSPMSERKKSMMRAKALNFSTSKTLTPRGKKNSNTSRPSTPTTPTVSREGSGKNLLRALQMKIKAALYGDDVRAFFLRCDKEKTGKMDLSKLKSICRKILKITIRDVPDENIEKLVKLMDVGGTGEFEINGIVTFVEDGVINGKPLEDINITVKKKKKKALYSWEVDEEPEEAKVLKMRGRKPISCKGDKENYNPCDEEIGWYLKEGAAPQDHWVDFRIIMSNAEYKELETRRRRWMQEQKHKERFEKIHKNREERLKETKQTSLHSMTPYVDKGEIERALW
eukprot:CAMPEP_0118646806 /NCGR_PEP_ID=MMETSP0785-20121206/8263_1 /TAXON_ID=91992 /ORGANISM="Bolidomonas pacifica, Strain CCMP 1866" /LENGTH=364 /DNA_ID=CAMNT_0006538845 /DNA_START=131 /DNA_END=1222 /DNA_ORIENTATION=+